MRRFLSVLVFPLLACVVLANPGHAEKRVALVIGNGAYTTVRNLTNPPRDAMAIGDLFKAAGFDDVTVRTDLGVIGMRAELREFARRAAGADIAAVFFAGHGIEVSGHNYLVPIDAKLEFDTDAEDEAIDLDHILQQLEPVKRLKLVILDACRENPFAPRMKSVGSSRDIGRGLAPPAHQGADTLVAYAAAAGETAADGIGDHSPFTAALLNSLARPGLDIRLAMGKVRDDVLRATSGRQMPFITGSLGGDTLSLAPANEVPLAPPDGALAAIAPASPALPERKPIPGPAIDPKCLAPWVANTKFFHFHKKPGPFRIALANGFIANNWRIQMIKMAKAYAAQPDVAAKLKEFKVVSTGEDVAAQIAAINNFIDSGYDAIVVNAQNPKAFGPVIKRAKEAGVVLVAFDNILDTGDAIDVDVDQKGLGVLWGDWLVENIPNGGKVLEVRGVAGTSVDTERHKGIHEALDKSGKQWNVVEVFGKWDDPTAQKATADALAVHKHFDGVASQGGDTGVLQAMIDAGHPFVPFGGETENGFRKLCAKYAGKGLKCSSAGTGPAQVAVAIKTAIAALEGQAVPQSIKLPFAIVEDPDFKDGVNYYSSQSDNFFAGNSFPTCDINFDAREIMSQSEKNQ